MNKIDIVLDGITITAQLRTELAPQTCQRLWALLPVEGLAVQGIWSGHAFHLAAPLDLGVDQVEDTGRSWKTTLYPGEIVYCPATKELTFGYGPAAQYRLGAAGPVPVTLVATAEPGQGGFEVFLEKARALQGKGAKPILLQRQG